jgi:4'-phosphopantetheinyl transferase EntD
VPLFYQQDINETTRVGIWKIEEAEDFFLMKVPLLTAIAHPQKRLQHLAGRYLLPVLFTDFPNKEIIIADTKKPFLPGDQYHFSISHCANFAAAIVSKNERVGVDVELVTPRVDKIKHKFLHAEELRFVNAQLQNEQLTLLTILWSAKEAMYKWYALGKVDFSKMMCTLPFSVGAEGEIQAVFLKGDVQKKLTLHYKLNEGLSIVWVASN